MAITTLNNRAINRSDTASADQVWTATSATASDFQAAGGGKIGQVLTSQLTTTVTRTSYNARADIAGLSRTITCAATSSKVLIHVTLYGQCTSGYAGMWHLMRDSTDIAVATSFSSRSSAIFNIRNSTAQNEKVYGQHITWLDSPSSTSELTYKIQWNLVDGSSGTIYLNRSIGDGDSSNRARTASNITCMEILA